jgi:hypothetical protein
MIQDFFSGQFNAAMHLRLLKKLLQCCILLSMLIYAAVRIVFFDIPFEWTEEIMLVLKMLATGSCFAAGISALLLTADLIQLSAKKWQVLHLTLSAKRMTIAIVLLIIAISACNAQLPAAGTVKDITTGLTATYKKLKPSKVLMVMNGEVIHHTDIPIGESFVLVNEGVKGLTVKDDKVAVGCSLTIKDKSGKILLQSDDLFKKSGILNKDSADYLRCTVFTGKPMKWEEHYYVTVVFWDKYGTGKIENKVTVRCIDIP